jgi:hypothetical protein
MHDFGLITTGPDMTLFSRVGCSKAVIGEIDAKTVGPDLIDRRRE